jgi:hypothetical protein
LVVKTIARPAAITLDKGVLDRKARWIKDMVEIQESPSVNQTHSEAKSNDAEIGGTTELLLSIARNATTDRITLGDLFDQLSDRAFGMILLILALPCCVPFIYGIPQIVALPMLFISGQIVAGRHQPWLPKKLLDRSFETSAFRDLAERSHKYIGWFERISKPRLVWLSKGVWERILGAFMVVFCSTILVPLPGTNTVPGFAVAVMSIGFMERDGLLILAGLAIGIAWTIILVASGAGLIALVAQLFGG